MRSRTRTRWGATGCSLHEAFFLLETLACRTEQASAEPLGARLLSTALRESFFFSQTHRCAFFAALVQRLFALPNSVIVQNSECGITSVEDWMEDERLGRACFPRYCFPERSGGGIALLARIFHPHEDFLQRNIRLPRGQSDPVAANPDEVGPPRRTLHTSEGEMFG